MSIPELDHDLLDRAKFQHYLNLEITGDFIPGITLRRRGKFLQLLYQGRIIATGCNIFHLETLSRFYRIVTGKQITRKHHDQLMKNIGQVYEPDNPVDWWITAPFKISRVDLFYIFDTLEAKGISYVIAP